MEILVTGPDGVLGSNLVRELLNRGYNISVLLEPGKDPITLKGLPIKLYYGNILDPAALNDAFVNKDVVFHCRRVVIRTAAVIEREVPAQAGAFNAQQQN